MQLADRDTDQSGGEERATLGNRSKCSLNDFLNDLRTFFHSLVKIVFVDMTNFKQLVI